MKSFYYNESGDVIEITTLRSEIDPSKVIYAQDYPAYTQKDGFSGKLVVRNGSLVWEYVENPPVPPDKTPSQLKEENIKMKEALNTLGVKTE